jgi:hypothetical protein
MCSVGSIILHSMASFNICATVGYAWNLRIELICIYPFEYIKWHRIEVRLERALYPELYSHMNAITRKSHFFSL